MSFPETALEETSVDASVCACCLYQTQRKSNFCCNQFKTDHFCLYTCVNKLSIKPDSCRRVGKFLIISRYSFLR